MIEVAAVFLAAFLLDLAIGDPAWPLHPVRLLGHLASVLERGLRAAGLSGFAGGGLFTLAHLAVTLAVWLGLGALAMAVHPRALDLLSVLAVYSSIAFRDLFDHAGPVRRALERGDLPAEQATLAATAAARLGRAVNTLDSMVGYRDERYRRFGWASASLDDLANFLPARLAVAALFVAALLLRLDAAAGLRVWLRDRRRHPSPNSGQAESYAAGALGVRLGGPTIYPHGMVTKGWLGDGTVEVTGLHLDRCCRLVRTAGCLAAAAVLLMALTLPAAAAAATGPAHRIVSLAPALTEDLFALGAGPAVVGDTEYCDYPAAARALPKVGGITSQSIHVERLLALKPDLVVAVFDEQGPVVDRLRRLGVRVEVMRSSTIEDAFQALRRLGELSGRQAEAGRLAAGMRQRIARVREKLAALPSQRRPRVFYQVWDAPLMTAGRGSFISQLIELAGGVNIFGDISGDYSQVSAEAVLQRNPEVILSPDRHGARVTAAGLVARPGWRQIAAVRARRVHVIDGDMVSRAGPRLVDSLDLFARFLHPEIFPPAGPGAKP